MSNVVDGATKVATSTLSALSGAPVVIGLLLVNIAFLGFTAYILGEVSGNAGERNKAQLAMISDLIHDIRDCRGGTPVPRRPDPTNWKASQDGGLPILTEDSR
jgi:hypothetical protein